MPRWPWIDRSFQFNYPVTKWPDLLERVRGTPARIEERIRGLSSNTLTRRPEDGGWTIQQNVGHLLDLGYLFLTRIEQILAGEDTLIAADMTNKRTNETDHNARKIADILREFRADRANLVNRLESLGQDDWGKSAFHGRLKKPVRIVDIAYFDAEHDDYHLARIGELIRILP